MPCPPPVTIVTWSLSRMVSPALPRAARKLTARKGSTTTGHIFNQVIGRRSRTARRGRKHGKPASSRGKFRNVLRATDRGRGDAGEDEYLRDLDRLIRGDVHDARPQHRGDRATAEVAARVREDDRQGVLLPRPVDDAGGFPLIANAPDTDA
jgi:hypothetical protein